MLKVINTQEIGENNVVIIEKLTVDRHLVLAILQTVTNSKYGNAILTDHFATL